MYEHLLGGHTFEDCVKIAMGQRQVPGTSDKGFRLEQKFLTEEITLLAAAETDSVIEIPAGAIVLGVSGIVTVVIPTAANFDVGIVGTLEKFEADVLVAALTRFKGLCSPTVHKTATKIRITPNLQPATATGKVRIVIAYLEATAPTS